MHRIAGAERMRERCSDFMDSIGPMMGMMDGSL